jgi:hypothetical protein
MKHQVQTYVEAKAAKRATAQDLTRVLVLVCTGISFSPHIVAIVCLTHLLLSETVNNEERIENDNDNF